MKFTTILLVSTLAITHVFASPLPMYGQNDRRPVTPDRRLTEKKMNVEGKAGTPANNPSGKLPGQGDKGEKPFRPEVGDVVTHKTQLTWKGKNDKLKSGPTSHPAVVINIEHPNVPEGVPLYHVLPMSKKLPTDKYPHQISNTGFDSLKLKSGAEASIATQPVMVTGKDKIIQRLSSSGNVVKVPDEQMSRLRTAIDECTKKTCKCKCVAAEADAKGVKHFICKLYYSVRIFFV